MSVRAGVDTGGTFTDLVLLDEASGEIRVTKVLSTLAEPSRSVFDSFEKAGVMTSDISDLVHGTTVATNARIERRGAGVALTTDGFRDILRMQRTTRPSHFDLHWIKPRARAREAAASGPQPAVVDGAARRGVVLAD